LIVFLTGKRDSPTDALEDYCRFLSGAFEQRGTPSQQVRVPWDKRGRARTLLDLWRNAGVWSGDWALVQYTALMWSRRGFPLLFLMVLAALRLRGIRVAVIFHDTEAYAGRRLVDRVRRACQLFVMRSAYWFSGATIVCVPTESVSWLPRQPIKARFIPIGANVPAITVPPKSAPAGHEIRTIAVFAVTDDGDISREIGDIVFAARAAAERLSRVRLVTLGRGSLESQSRFRQALEGSAVEYSALGVLPAGEVSRVLSASDLSLFVRGPISTQRGSAVASIACGVPLVAYADSRLPDPLAEAGVVGVRLGDREGLADAAARVLSDRELWLELHRRSERAHQRYFSWDAVSGRFAEVLSHA
jgi:glycosyltransferase involved in cell wall biosynthesis